MVSSTYQAASLKASWYGKRCGPRGWTSELRMLASAFGPSPQLLIFAAAKSSPSPAGIPVGIRQLSTSSRIWSCAGSLAKPSAESARRSVTNTCHDSSSSAACNKIIPPSTPAACAEERRYQYKAECRTRARARISTKLVHATQSFANSVAVVGVEPRLNLAEVGLRETRAPLLPATSAIQPKATDEDWGDPCPGGE